MKEKWSEGHAQVEHSMHLRIPHLTPDIGADDLDLLDRVVQVPGEERVCECFEAFHDLKVVP